MSWGTATADSEAVQRTGVEWLQRSDRPVKVPMQAAPGLLACAFACYAVRHTETRPGTALTPARLFRTLEVRLPICVINLLDHLIDDLLVIDL